MNTNEGSAVYQDIIKHYEPGRIDSKTSLLKACVSYALGQLGLPRVMASRLLEEENRSDNGGNIQALFNGMQDQFWGVVASLFYDTPDTVQEVKQALAPIRANLSPQIPGSLYTEVPWSKRNREAREKSLIAGVIEGRSHNAVYKGPSRYSGRRYSWQRYGR